MKILVVDDSRTIRAGMANLIGRMGHAVIEAENGEEALRLFAEERPELVLHHQWRVSKLQCPR